MKQIILQEPGKFKLLHTEISNTIQAGEALVRVHNIGICGTDLHAFRGKQPFFTYPRVLGHELGVEVVKIGENSHGLSVGDRCSVEPYLNCGHCIACLRGKTNCCTQLKVLGVHTDGGMQELIKVPVQKLHTSAKLSYEQLALVETLGIGAHAVERASLTENDTVLIIGAGPIGLAVSQFAQLACPTIIMMDKEESRLSFCMRQMKLKHIVRAGDNALQAIKEILQGDLPTVVFDATGNAESMMRSFDYAAHGGKLIFVGLFQGNVTFHDPEFHKRELSLLASRNATGQNFNTIINLMERGEIDTKPWITHRTTIDTMIDEFAGWLEPGNGVLKAVVEIN
jgi:2-desacetyl-2-hydroxyethyl bacteriochlorophyllide A dehydrogenase